MNNNLSETFPKGYVEVRNSPKIAAKFYLLAVMAVLIEAMVLSFLYMMGMDDSVEWTGELLLYVGAAVVLPAVIFVEAIVGARIVSQESIRFDNETILLNLKFRRPTEVKWSRLGGMVRTGSMGFLLVDREGKKVVAADITMTNYNAFYDMAIRQCKDYKKEQKKEKTGTFAANTGRLGMDPAYMILVVLFGFGISTCIMAALVELSGRVPEIDRFVQSLSIGKVCLMMSCLPTVGLCIFLPLQIRRCWKYSDHGLEICYVFRKKVQLSWAQIRRVEIEVMKTQQGESYGFVLYTSSEKYSSKNLLTKGSLDFKLQVGRMEDLYGFEVRIYR